MNEEKKETSDENFPSSPENSERYAEHCLELFFETSLEYSKLLIGPENLSPLNEGELGEGIYFASSFEQVDQNCNGTGVIFKALVKVGKPLIIKNIDLIRKYNYSELQSEGYDSILVTCLEGGNQYVIFDSTQILGIHQIKNLMAEDPNKMIVEEPPISNKKSDINIALCQYGDSCYNQNPRHIQECHPLKAQFVGFYGHNWIADKQEHTCPFREKCYRQNWEHRRDCHPPGFIPAARPW